MAINVRKLIYISLLSILAACNRSSPINVSNQKLNVLLIIVDTLGAEHVGAYHSGLANTPHIDSLAKNGVIFKRAYSTAPWTKPSIASTLTGLPPKLHHVRGVDSILAPEYTTLAEMFKNIGAKTAGVVSHTFLVGESGYSQGFDSYKLVDFKGNVHDSITSDKVTDGAKEWLTSEIGQNGQSQFFMFVHYFDPHYNYQHHPEFDYTTGYKGKLTPGKNIRILRRKIPKLTKEDVNYLVGLHHEEIAFTDFHIGRLLEHLKNLQIDSRTLVIFTADHGEEFMRHGLLGHTSTLYDELIHVPLIFYLPGVLKPHVVDTSVSLVDIVPTVRGFVSKLAQDSNWTGQSLLPLLEDKSISDKPRALFSEVDFKSSHIKAYKAAIMRGDFKLIYDKPTKKWELYDRVADPDELHNMVPTKPELVQELAKELKAHQDLNASIESKEESPTLKHSPEEIEQLKSLGYM